MKHERGTKTTYPRPDYRRATTDAEAIAEAIDAEPDDVCGHELPADPEIRIPVPPRVYAKLAEVARPFGSVERWARHVLAEAAEEAQPSLRDSGLWSMHCSEWSTLVSASARSTGLGPVSMRFVILSFVALVICAILTVGIMPVEHGPRAACIGRRSVNHRRHRDHLSPVSWADTLDLTTRK